MSYFDNTTQFMIWQGLVNQAQDLALKMPELGLNIDVLPVLPIDQVTDILAFLKRSYAERESE